MDSIKWKNIICTSFQKSKDEIKNLHDDTIESVKVDGEEIKTTDTMKVLGLNFDSKLTWKAQVELLKKKLNTANNGIKLIRRKLDAKQTLMVVTAQALSILYYGAIVWLTPALSKALIKQVEGLHYRCVRLVLRDYRQRISRAIIDKATKRLPPLKWSEYAACNFYINAKNQGGPERLLASVSENLYAKSRFPGLTYGYDNSKTKVARQMTKNWIGQALSLITTPWTNRELNKDQVRTLIKKFIYPEQWSDV